MALAERIENIGRRLGVEPALERQGNPLPFQEWVSYFNYMGNAYPYMNLQQSLPGVPQEPIGQEFAALAAQAYKSNGPIFALMAVRFLLFSEARFQFRRLTNGRPGDLFGTAELGVLETPWPNGTTGDLLTRAITDVDLAGNFFVRRQGNTLQRMRPDWVTIVIGSSRPNPDIQAGDLEAEVVGYLYEPGGPSGGREPVFVGREVAAHWAPYPDPTAWYRGMPWLTPVVREIMGDAAASEHKLKFFENGATPNMVVTFGDGISVEKFEAWITKFRETHEGPENAYRTLFLAGGASADVVGADMRELDFKSTQGAGETRLASAAGVPAAIVGFSEGLAGSSLNAGNYGQARRRLSDGTLRPLWRGFAAAMQSVIRVPGGAELWYDDRDIAFLREDLKDQAEISQIEANTLKVLIDAGFEPESVKSAVLNGDWSRLEHTNLFSVQLQPPTPEGPPEPEPGAALEVEPGSPNGSAVPIPTG